MLLFLTIFVFLFVLHEVEEYFILVPWLKSHRPQLPGLIQRWSISKSQFVAVAVEELVLIILIGLFLDFIWLKATLVAYTVHLVIHCGQMIVTHIKAFAFTLWSALLQIPLAIGLLILMPPTEKSNFLLASLTMFVFLVINLIFMHSAVKKICN